MRIALATVEHLWRHLLAQGGRVPAEQYRRLVAEVLGRRVWAGIAHDGTPLALGGVMRPAGVVPGMVWLSVLPRASAAMPSTTLAMRRVLRREAGAAVHGLACWIEDTNTAGGRLARLLGFAPTDLAVGTLRQWRL